MPLLITKHEVDDIIKNGQDIHYTYILSKDWLAMYTILEDVLMADHRNVDLHDSITMQEISDIVKDQNGRVGTGITKKDTKTKTNM